MSDGRTETHSWLSGWRVKKIAGPWPRAGNSRPGVQPDGAPVELPEVRVRPGGYRFLPNGTGLVYLPGFSSLDFWLVDFRTKESRQLTRLSNQGTLATFDITPDGEAIVFDRSRENSDIVLIELPK